MSEAILSKLSGLMRIEPRTDCSASIETGIFRVKSPFKAILLSAAAVYLSVTIRLILPMISLA